MAAGKSVFIIGPGFIGWNVLDLLIAGGYSVRGLVRREQHGSQIKTSGATPVLGDLNDKELIMKETIEHSIIIHTATADHLPSVEAVLEGIRQRIKQGKHTIFIHTSGTSVLDDGANGEFKSEKIYHDNVRSEIDSVADNAPHRPIDSAIVKAQKEFGEKAKLAIIIPPLIYGLVPAHQRLSIQIPGLTRFARKHGYAGHVGKGLAVESHIHVLDLARAYLVLLYHMEKASPADFLENPYFFCEASGDHEHSWREVSEAIGKGLHSAGKIQDPKPKVIPEKLFGDLFGASTGWTVGPNSRSRAVRLRELGWQPKEKDWRSSFFDDELPVLLREDIATSSS